MLDRPPDPTDHPNSPAARDPVHTWEDRWEAARARRLDTVAEQALRLKALILSLSAEDFERFDDLSHPSICDEIRDYATARAIALREGEAS